MRSLTSFGTVKANLVITCFHQQIFRGEPWIWYMARACVNRGSCEGKQLLPAHPCNLICDSLRLTGPPPQKKQHLQEPEAEEAWLPDLQAAVSVYREHMRQTAAVAAAAASFIAAAERICTNKCLPVKVHLCHMCTVHAPITVTALSHSPQLHLQAPWVIRAQFWTQCLCWFPFI